MTRRQIVALCALLGAIGLVAPTEAASGLCAAASTCLVGNNSAIPECHRGVDKCPPCVLPQGQPGKFACFERDSKGACGFAVGAEDCSAANASTTANTTAPSTPKPTTTPVTTPTPSSSSDSTSSPASSTESTPTSSTPASSSPASSVQTTTDASTGGSSKKLFFYIAAAGSGVMVMVLIMVAIQCRRNRQKEMGQHPKTYAQSESPAYGFNDPVARKVQQQNNTADVSLGLSWDANGFTASALRKVSDPVMLESSQISGGANSMEGMAVLGDPQPARNQPNANDKMRRRGSSNAKMPRAYSRSKDLDRDRTNSSNSATEGDGKHRGIRSSSVLSRNTVGTGTASTANSDVYGEYLKVKEGMSYEDEGDVAEVSDSLVSDLSDVMNGDFSIVSMLRETSESMTESEFDPCRLRGESDCYSEMSFNDEKYSFCDDEGSETMSENGESNDKDTAGKGSAAGPPEREVEI